MIQITPLGAGQDVGRSCILVSLGDKNILLDCGMHMGFDDDRRFPDFWYISRSGNFTPIIDCVIISHFHLDHCGSLPYFTEMCGYDGPVYMTEPTRAIVPLLLEDYRKITMQQQAQKDINFFTSDDIKNCMAKVVTVGLHESLTVGVGADTLELKAYYAGHVLGAAMFLIKYKNMSVVYTGDYNMVSDRHLGAAWIDNVKPDVLITETTYATTVRDSKKARERDFLHKIHECVEAGGKVLIPVFALGRAQELCILIESYWERMNLKTPIYFSAGMTQKANTYYRMYINWTNEKLKSMFPARNMFDFKHIRPFDMSYVDQPGPAVLFASPGMLHAGFSLEVFKKWATNPKNMVILPGYCVPGTVGARVLAGEKLIELDKMTSIQVNLKVEHLSFSAHADSKGILQLIKTVEPKHVVLVHGEARKMSVLKAKVTSMFDIGCYFPENGENLCIPVSDSSDVYISKGVIDGVVPVLDKSKEEPFEQWVSKRLKETHAKLAHPFSGVMLGNQGEKIKVVSIEEFREEGFPSSWITFEKDVSFLVSEDAKNLQQGQEDLVETFIRIFKETFEQRFPGRVKVCENQIVIDSSIIVGVTIAKDEGKGSLKLSWEPSDDEIVQQLMALLE